MDQELYVPQRFETEGTDGESSHLLRPREGRMASHATPFGGHRRPPMETALLVVVVVLAPSMEPAPSGVRTWVYSSSGGGLRRLECSGLLSLVPDQCACALGFNRGTTGLSCLHPTCTDILSRTHKRNKLAGTTPVCSLWRHSGLRQKVQAKQ